MGANARGIGSRNRWPCVGDPETWHVIGEWNNCAAEGSLSLMALVPGAQVASYRGDPLEPVVVHITACKQHVRSVRRWLAAKVPPGEEVDTYGTEFVMREWNQIVEQLDDVPVLRMVAAG